MFNLCYDDRYSRGFQMTFSNGYTVSVQWGAGNYCDNRTGFGYYDEPPGNHSATAEVAAWSNSKASGVFNPSWFIWGHDDVCGYLTADQVVKFMAYMASLTDEDPTTVVLSAEMFS